MFVLTMNLRIDWRKYIGGRYATKENVPEGIYVTGYYGEKKITWNIAVIPNGY